MSNLHGEIMNLPCDKAKADRGYVDHRQAYRYGHRDARHAAAELVAAHEADHSQSAEADGVDRTRMIESMCLMWRHDFGLEKPEDCPLSSGMTDAERDGLRRQMGQLFDHHFEPALSAVTAERDRLREALRAEQDRYQRDVYGLNNEGDPIGGEPAGGYANDNAKLRAEVEGMRKDAALGSAVQRACCDLPEGFMISVSLEKDAGTLELCLPDTDAVLDDFDGETFAGKIHQAIDAAMAAQEGV